MRRRKVAVCLRALLLLCQLPAPGVRGQEPPPQPDMTIDSGTRAQVIEAAIKALNEGYIFPETAREMEAMLRERLQRKEYDGISRAKEFAAMLTNHLQEVSRDKHLRVRYSQEVIPVRPNLPPSPEERERMLREAKRANFGFEKVERLAGNIGYLDLRGFMAAAYGAPTAAAAMNLLANSDALIVDLRRNGGGDPAMVAFITSYLYDDSPVHLNDLYFRPTDSTRQWWTLPHVPGARLGSKTAVYVLTSNRTFSAAEEFTYNLKSLKRATIIGETTGGGAHPGGNSRLHDHFSMFVPRGRAINPITKTNWEGTGVEPDIKVPAEHALKIAHLTAVTKLRETAADEQLSQQYSRLSETLRKEVEELKKDQKPD
jgi:hypothetical protein